jgi:hypothetical protein
MMRRNVPARRGAAGLTKYSVAGTQASVAGRALFSEMS